VTIGKNSIVGAGSVVTSDIKPNVIAAGNPAKAIKTLDPDQPITTRKDRFSDSHAMTRDLENAEKLSLHGNTLWGWIKSLFVS
jgi:serine acetyltransferase